MENTLQLLYIHVCMEHMCVVYTDVHTQIAKMNIFEMEFIYILLFL